MTAELLTHRCEQPLGEGIVFTRSESCEQRSTRDRGWSGTLQASCRGAPGAPQAVGVIVTPVLDRSV